MAYTLPNLPYPTNALEPSIDAMTTAIVERQMGQADPAELARMLDELNNISPDEIQKLLEAEGESAA